MVGSIRGWRSWTAVNHVERLKLALRLTRGISRLNDGVVGSCGRGESVGKGRRPQARDRALEARQQRRAQRITIGESDGEAQLGLHPPVELDAMFTPVYDPVFPYALPRVEL